MYKVDLPLVYVPEPERPLAEIYPRKGTEDD
jgi:hypothetical protein